MKDSKNIGRMTNHVATLLNLMITQYWSIFVACDLQTHDRDGYHAHMFLPKLISECYKTGFLVVAPEFVINLMDPE